MVVIKVWNSGNKEVAKEDYDTPVSFEFINRVVIGSEVLSTEPSDLMQPDVQKAFLRLQNNRVVFSEYLLNQGQSIRVNVLTSGGKDAVKQWGRIKGGDVHIYAPTSSVNPLIPLGFGMGIVLVTWLILNSAFNVGKSSSASDMIIVVLAGGAAVSLLGNMKSVVMDILKKFRKKLPSAD